MRFTLYHIKLAFSEVIQLSIKRYASNTQTSLADREIIEEENCQQAKKADMLKKYRIISLLLAGVIIVSVLVYLFTVQTCMVFGHTWQAATCTTENNGHWHMIDTFVLDGDSVEVNFQFDEPISFDA